MKILIGILILLFVLTTISFSDTAYAAECGQIYALSHTEYLPSEQVEDAGFNEFTSPYYIEANPRSQFNAPSDFESNPSHNRDWDPNPTF